MAAGGGGALVLLVAEFTPLFSVHSGLHGGVIKTVSTGSHHAYGLALIAVLAVALSAAARRARNPLALLAVGLLGVVALLIALLHDLPDTQATGLIGNPVTHFAVATSSPDIGFFLETLGAVLLLLSAGAGLMLTGLPPLRRPRPSGASA